MPGRNCGMMSRISARAALSCGLLLLSCVPAVAQNARWAIWLMKTDGSEARMVAQVEGCNRHHSPRWSHDGKRIAFAASSASNRDSKIYIVNVDGSDLKEFAAQEHPDWSPDDKQIVFYSSSPGGRSIFVAGLDGQGRTEIASGRSPRWSPDGSKLALTENDNVYVHDVVSGETRALFGNAFNVVYNGMAWFPDGKRLAVVVRPEQRKHRQLLFVNAEGEDQGVDVRMESELSGFLSFSPDGKKLLIDNAYKMHILEVEGKSPPVTIKGQQGANTEAEWSPDGQWIAFTSSRDIK